ncbi:unnamed protein product [Prunus armeniaca]
MKGDGRCLKLFLALSILFLQNVKGGEVGHSHSHSHSLRDAKMTVRCIERERQALLAFKRGLVDHFNVLSLLGVQKPKNKIVADGKESIVATNWPCDSTWSTFIFFRR